MRASSPVHVATTKCNTEMNSNCNYTTVFVLQHITSVPQYITQQLVSLTSYVDNSKNYKRKRNDVHKKTHEWGTWCSG